VQGTVSQLRRLDGADDPLTTRGVVVNDDLDWLHALGCSPGDCATATDKLGQLREQSGVQALQEPRREAAAFARCQA
jgi:hypothetical protein